MAAPAPDAPLAAAPAAIVCTQHRRYARERLFPTNEAFTAEHAATLKIIAAELGCPVNAVYICNGASGPAVLFEDHQGSAGTRCACDLQSLYWKEARPPVRPAGKEFDLRLST
jgi:hypothetical protein